MNSEEDEFKRIEREAKRRAAQDDDDDTQEYLAQRAWVGLTYKEAHMTDQQKVWEALRAIYGMDLTAATLVVLTKDGETAVKFQTIYFPQQETEK